MELKCFKEIDLLYIIKTRHGKNIRNAEKRKNDH